MAFLANSEFAKESGLAPRTVYRNLSPAELYEKVCAASAWGGSMGRREREDTLLADRVGLPPRASKGHPFSLPVFSSLTPASIVFRGRCTRHWH